jgi:hypothetical protein
MEGLLPHMSITQMLEEIKKMNPYCNLCNNPSEEQERFKNTFTKEKAEMLLSTFTDQSLINSKKPLWIEETKKTCNRLIPVLDYKELEETKEMLMDDGECYFDLVDYPYYHTIKKLLYAFGDTVKSNHKTIILFHDFIKKWLIEIGKLVQECEFKKVLEHLYSFEIAKYNTSKKLSIKNNFNNMEEIIVDNDEDVLIDLDERRDFIDNIFEDKDSEYYENLIYQDERTKKMTEQEYIEYNMCRTQSFMSKNKKIFLNYLTTLMPNLPYDLKDQSNMELVSFLIKELIHKIVKQAIKNKNPENKLFILKHPLLVCDVEELINQELDTIESFLSDYYNSIYLIKEFKKKRVSKDNNKNVKVRKDGHRITLIIKKFVFLDDSETFKKYKKLAENKLTSLIKKLSSGRNKEKQTQVIEEIANYYEYFLMKDYFTILSRDKVQYNPSNLRKINKKYISTKLKQWLSLSTYEREIVINEYNNI